MASLPSIPSILQAAQIREYLSAVQITKDNAFSGGSLDQRLTKLIDAVRQIVQWNYTYNPNDPTLIATGNYLWSLVAPPVSILKVLQPTILSAVAVTSNEIDLSWTPVTNGVTYTLQRSTDPTFNSGVVTVFSGSGLAFPDTGLNPSTQYFYRINVSAPGFVTSPYSFASATTQGIVPTITISWWYGASSPYATLQGGTDNLSYQGSFNITHNIPISVPYPSAATPNMYLVIRVPIGESIKTTWFNTVLNNGNIPDAIFEAALQPAGLPIYTYYVTRVAMSLDGVNPLVLT